MLIKVTNFQYFNFVAGLHSSIWSGIGHNNQDIEATTQGLAHLKHQHQKLSNREREADMLRKIDEIFQFSDEKPMLPSVEQITQPMALGN